MECLPEYGSISVDQRDQTKLDLISAASLGDLKQVQYLLSRNNCNPDITNTSGWTPLMYSAHYGHYNVVRLLIDAKCDVNLREYVHGKTALMLAASNGHTRCVETLVNYGKAKLELEDFHKKTAADYATMYGHGSNKLIAQHLGISNSCSAPRRITKLTPKQPKIMVSSPADRQESSELLKEIEIFTKTPCSSQNVALGQMMDNISTCWSSGASPFHKLNLQTPSPQKNSSTTPQYQVSSSLAQRRKRKLNGWEGCTPTYSNGNSSHLSSRSSVISHQGSFVNSPVNSPPLPATLDQLLTRIGLEEYQNIFDENGIDLYVFLTLSELDLKELGIARLGHRRKLFASQLRFRESVEIKSVQENFLADWLLIERENILIENQTLKEEIVQLRYKLKQMEEDKLID